MRFSLLLSLALHGAVVWLMRPSDLPIYDISELQVFETEKAEKKKTSSASARPQSVNRANTQAPTSENISPSTQSQSLVSANSESSSAMEPVEASSSSLTEQPRVIKAKKVAYPPSALRAGIEGIVLLRIVVNTQGEVASAEVIRGPGFGTNEAALKAIREFIFSPGKIGEQKVPVRLQYRFQFSETE